MREEHGAWKLPGEMHIVARPRCQRPVWSALAAFGLIWPLAGAPAEAFSQAAPAGTPRETASPASATTAAWQQELNAAVLLETAAAFAPNQEAAGAPGREERLLKIYADLARKYPDQGAVQRAAGDFCRRIGRGDLAVGYWQRAQALDPHDAASAESLGNAALARADVREARRQFQWAVDASPGEAAYHFDLANTLYLFRHDFADPPGDAGSEAVLVDALEQFRQAASLAPSDARLAEAYAESFYILAKPDWNGALAAWDKVRVLHAPDSDFANGHLARVSLRLGLPDQAERYLAAIHNPLYDPMKAKLRAQAEKLRQAPANPP